MGQNTLLRAHSGILASRQRPPPVHHGKNGYIPSYHHSDGSSSESRPGKQHGSLDLEPSQSASLSRLPGPGCGTQWQRLGVSELDSGSRDWNYVSWAGPRVKIVAGSMRCDGASLACPGYKLKSRE